MADREAVGERAVPVEPDARQDVPEFDDQLLAELLLSAKLLSSQQLAEAQARLLAADPGGMIDVPRAFVTDPVAVLVQAVDAASGEVEGQVPLGEPVGDPGLWPSWSSGQILVLRPDEPEIEAIVATAPGAILGLFPTPVGSFLYPGAFPNRELSPDVAVLPSAFVAPASVTNRPLDLIGSPSGEFLVAINRGAGSAHVLVPNTCSQIGGLNLRSPGTKRSMGVAIHDRIAYITDGLTSRLTIVELTTLKVRHQAFPTGPLGPIGIAPDGQFLYMVFYKGSEELGLLTVTAADLRVRHLLNLPGRRIESAPLEPFRVMPGGQLAYLAVQELAGRFRLVAIDLVRKKIAKELPLDGLPLTLAVSPPRRWLPPKRTLEEAIVELGYATAAEIRRVQEADPGSPLQDPRIDPQLVGQLPERMLRTMGLVPMYREGGELLVAMANPRDPTALQLAAQLAGGLKLKVTPVSDDDLASFLSERYPLLMERYHALRASIPAGPIAGSSPPPAPQGGGASPAAESQGGKPTREARLTPMPPSVRPSGPPPEPPAIGPRPAVKDYPSSVDSWVGPQGGRVLLVDAIRRQVVEILRDRREGWSYRNFAAGGASYLPGGDLILVDSATGKILEIDPAKSEPVWTFESGDRTKQIRGAKGLSQISNGNVLVADTGNHRVVEITKKGDIVWTYGDHGKAGCAHGSLFKPQGAWRAKNGNTWIADTGNHRVIEVNEAGEVVWQYGNHVNRLGGGQGSGVNQLSEPAMAIALAGGSVLLADTGNQRVLEVDAMKQIVWHYRPGAARGGTPIRDPQCIARGANGSTFIAGRSGVIEVTPEVKIVWEFHFGGKAESPWSTASVGDAPAGQDPTGMDFEPARSSAGQEIPVNLPDSFVLVDRLRNRILEIDRQMQVVWQFTGLGGGERNRIEQPHWAARQSTGNTLVTDTMHHRVVEVRDNAVVWQFGKRGESGDSLKHLCQPRSAERSPSRTTIISDFGNRRVLEVNAAQECVWHKDNWQGPVYAAKLPSGNILVVDWSAHAVIEVDDRGIPVWQYGQIGNNGNRLNQLFHPEHASRLDNGNTLICDTQNHRVLEVTPDKAIAWQYGGAPEFLGRKGRFGLQMLTPIVAWRLPNGHTMVHHAGANHVVEVEPDLGIVWHFTLTF